MNLLSPTALRLTTFVVAHSDRNRPADGVLRETLKAQRGLTREEGRRVSEAVFAWQRWRAWVIEQARIEDQVQAALELAERFAHRPERFDDEKLMAQAIPAWTREVMDVTAPWVRALQREPRLWLRARPGTGDALVRALGWGQPAGSGPLADALHYTGPDDLFRTEAFHAGEFEVQDIASQWVGWLCAPQAGQTWWDACAGEGGKLLHLSDLMENRGLIWASDRADWRLRHLRQRTARARVFNYRAAPWDGSERLPTKTKFDGVLVDAPCAGLGTWHRNPHARWTMTPTDVAELSDVQTRLLQHAATAVKPGGRLIYSVCTLTRAETLGVATRFGEANQQFEPLALEDPFQSAAPAQPQHWTWPQDRGGNGMFVAAWRRKG